MSAACRGRPICWSSWRQAKSAGRSSRQPSTRVSLGRCARSFEKQIAAGIDSVCDGELGKISYTFYVRHRLSGITAFRGGEVERPPQTAAHRDLLDHPDFTERLNQARGGTAWFSREAVPCCTGPVAYVNRAPLETDPRNLAAACAVLKPVESLYERRLPRGADKIRAGPQCRSGR